MNTLRRLTGSAASIAIMLLFATGSISLAQKVDWKADALASPFPKPQTEQELIEQLRSAPPEGKAMACKQLSIYGSKAAVPELAKLLSDPQLASWARIALEAIPDQSADAALVEAAKSIKGELLVGVINSIGERRSAEAIDQLSSGLKDSDIEVASAAAVALGKIGGDQVIHTLHQAYDAAPPAVRAAIAEGGILCAERLVAEGDNQRAIQIYDLIRSAEVPEQRILEATRGAILARGAQGVPLLVEQLRSPDKKRFQIGLTTARQLAGPETAAALTAELSKAAPDRAALIVVALGDQPGAALPRAVLAAAHKGDDQVRLAAIGVVGRLGSVSNVPALLEIAAESNAELAQAAKTAIADLRGDDVNSDLLKRLRAAKGKPRVTLIELVDQRRIQATPELVKSLDDSDKSIRKAALAALGATVTPKDLSVLIKAATQAKNDADRDDAVKALREASIRMPDREATAAELAAAMSRVSTAAKASLLRILGEMGGPNSLKTVGAAAQSKDAELRDVSTRVLGEWMTADAAPVLLVIANDKSPQNKYQTRALRGYLRIARQLDLPDNERIEMCRTALKIAERAEERKLALEALKKCPSAESVELASALMKDDAVRDDAVEVAIFIGEKIKDKDPAAAKSAGTKALEASPDGELAERARALTSP